MGVLKIMREIAKKIPATLTELMTERNKTLTPEQIATNYPEILKLNLPKNTTLNISTAEKLRAEVKNRDICDQCDGQKTECNIARFKIGINENTVTAERLPTCRKQEQYLAITRLLSKAEIPAVFRHISPGKDFEITDGNKKAAYLAEQCIDSEKGLYIYGKVRTGKTMLSCIIANERAKQGKPSLFITVPDMLDELKDFSNPNRRTEKLNLFYNTPCLIIDDIGAEYQTEWTAAELFRILDKRIKFNRQTIINSNFTLEQLQSHMKGYNAKRVCGRIAEMCEPVYIER